MSVRSLRDGDDFAIAPGVTYLDAATYGPAPRSTAKAMRDALSAWESGQADWIEDWDRKGELSRAAFAQLIGASPDEVALIPASSVGLGTVATLLRRGDEVLVPIDEFTSVLFPLYVAERDRGATVREVPFQRLADAIGPQTRFVGFSLVRMQTGETAALGDICAAAERYGTQLLVDATQALPFVRLDDLLDRIDYLVCSGYKHLLCPRGTAFLYVRKDHWDDIRPINANWRAADRPYGRYFGGPLTLAPSASRFDVSLAWLAWVGAAESLRLLTEWRNDGRLDRVSTLAVRLASAVGLPPPSSTLVCTPVPDLEAARAALRANSVRASVRGNAVRFSPHVYNTPSEIDRAADVVRSLLVPR